MVVVSFWGVGLGGLGPFGFPRTFNFMGFTVVKISYPSFQTCAPTAVTAGGRRCYQIQTVFKLRELFAFQSFMASSIPPGIVLM